MGKVIAVANEKGGVGKTTGTVTIADILASWGHSVLLTDNDPQGNATLSFRGSKEDLEAHIRDVYNGKVVKPILIKERLHLLGSNKQLGKELDRGFEIVYDFAETLDKYLNQYDFILIDCLPSTSYFLAASLLAADYVVIPIIPEPYAVDGLKEVLDTIKKYQRPKFNPNLKIIGVFINCVPGKPTIITKSIIEGLEKEYKDLIFTSKVTRGTAIVESPTKQQSIIEYAPDHKLAQEFSAVTRELLMRIDEGFTANLEQVSKHEKEIA